MTVENNWWHINKNTLVDTPFLAIYFSRVQHNIQKLISLINGDTARLRPHIKTHKTGQVLELLKTYHISKTKCATIAEAELCAIHHITDIMLAYPLCNLKINRWIALIKKYPHIKFSAIIEKYQQAQHLSSLATQQKLNLNLYIDINVGMNRTGIAMTDNWQQLALDIINLPGLTLEGLHIYDGHIKGTYNEREKAVLSYANNISTSLYILASQTQQNLKIVAGGTNTFPFYAKMKNIECSPGTFIFWDTNYTLQFTEQDFKPAALIVAQVISKPQTNYLCVDIGYKAVACENPLHQRLHILNDTNLEPFSHSEEHLVLENKGKNDYDIGHTIYALPYHICPTCALYDVAHIVNDDNNIYTQWNVLARNRKITL